MLRAETIIKNEGDHISNNITSINIDVINNLQKEIDPCDTISLIFLLYDAPDTALQRIQFIQRIVNDINPRNVNCLYDWAINAQSRPSWRHEFLEALAICQLHRVIRNLGFNVENVKKHYLPNNIHVHIYVNQFRKALFKCCEIMTMENLQNLKKTLLTYDIDLMDHSNAELVLLEMMSRKFIDISYGSKECNIGKFIKILNNIPELKSFSDDLMQIEKVFNDNYLSNSNQEFQINYPKLQSSSKNCKVDSKAQKKFDGNFNDVFEMIKELDSEESSLNNLKPKDNKIKDNIYAVKNSKCLGVCYIINQESFHLSKDSLKQDNRFKLEKRLGSDKDKALLEKTLESLNLEVISHDNLDHKKMMQNIKDIVKYRVHHDHSVFVLSILSHGVRNHVFAADSVKVSVEEIQNFLESDEAKHLHKIPKVLFIQACQVSEAQTSGLVSDLPGQHQLRKLDFLIFWATAPELEAYRDTEKGSIFIRILCCVLESSAEHDHLLDICTKVTLYVSRICRLLKEDQVPYASTTLSKKFYFK